MLVVNYNGKLLKVWGNFDFDFDFFFPLKLIFFLFFFEGVKILKLESIKLCQFEIYDA